MEGEMAATGSNENREIQFINNINYLLFFKTIIIGGSLTMGAAMKDQVPSAKKRFMEPR